MSSVPGAKEVRRGHWIPWNWSCGGYELPCGYWESNLGPLQGQQMLLTTGPSLQPLS